MTLWLQSTCATDPYPIVLVVDSSEESTLTIPAPLFAQLAPTRLGEVDVLVEQVWPERMMT